MVNLLRRLSVIGFLALVGLALFGAGALARDFAPATTPAPAGVIAANYPAGAPTGNSAAVSDLQSALVAAAEKVRPAVVSVRTESGLGSGVIYDSSGLVLTNAHVISGTRNITVGLLDGRRLPAQILGQDAGFDLAVLKINANNLPVASFGDSAILRPGEFAIAIGNPYGFNYSVTEGIVSAINRPVSEGQDSYNQPMIQTDAAINPGNSGGPLVNLNGDVIGINTLVAAPQGVAAQGLGFSIPINTVKRIAPQLVSDGRVTRSGQPYLGVSLTDNSSAASRRATGSAVSTPGALLGQIVSGGPADKAGIKLGDVVTALNGNPVTSADDLLAQLVIAEPGTKVKVTVERSGNSQTIDLTLGEAPPR